MKKLITSFMVVSMLAIGLTAVFAPVGVDATTTGTLDLGVRYAKDTGLGNDDIRSTVASIIRVAMGLLGIVAVVIILIGGFTWMTAGGNDEKVGEAKKWIFSGIIGLAIILSAYALTEFVMKSLVDATGATTDGADTFI